jgi:hypothetical protein
VDALQGQEDFRSARISIDDGKADAYLMPWSEDPIEPVLLKPPGWHPVDPNVPAVSQPGWWVGLDLDIGLAVVYLNAMQLRTVGMINIVHSVSMSRQLALKGIYPLAVARNMNVAVDLQMRGIYMFNTNVNLGFNSQTVIRSVKPLSLLPTDVNVGVAIALAKIRTFEASTQIVASNYLELTKIRTLALTQTIGFQSDMGLTFIQGVHAPETVQSNAAGNYTYGIPNWVILGNLIDWILLGGGGGSQAGGYFFAQGNGGGSGKYTSGTIIYGTTIPAGTTQLTGYSGDGGPTGTNPFALQPGYPGQASTLNAVGALAAQSGAGGGGGGATGGSGSVTGLGPGNRTQGTLTMTGGGNVGGNANGAIPGGGGGGGYPAWGGAGAIGRVAFKARTS